MFTTDTEPGDRLQAALRKRYPVNAAKLLAREFDCKPETAKRWLAGEMPRSATLLEMFDRFGNEFIAEVGGNSEWARTLRLEADIAALRIKLAAVQQTLDEIGAEIDGAD